MSPSHAILRDLMSGQSTIASIAGRLKKSPAHVKAIISPLVTESLVAERYICIGYQNALTVYLLTQQGRDSISN